MKKLAIVAVFGLFGLVGFGESVENIQDSTQESTIEAQSSAQAEPQAEQAKQTDLDSQANAESQAQTESQANVESQAQSGAQVDAESSAELASKEDSQVEIKYPNSDWEVWGDLHDSQWSKKHTECSSLALESKEKGDKCVSTQAKKLHQLCKNKEGDKYCAIKAALFSKIDDGKLTQDIDSLYKSCDKGYGASCEIYAMVVGKLGDKANSLRLSQKACELGSAFGCAGVGGFYLKIQQDALKAKPYIDKAIDLTEQGCKNGFEVACKTLVESSIKEVKDQVEAEIKAREEAQKQAQEEQNNAGKKSKKSKK